MVLGSLSAVVALSGSPHFLPFQSPRGASGRPSPALHSLTQNSAKLFQAPSCAPDLVLTSLFEPQAAAPSPPPRPEPRCITLSPFPRSGVLDRLLRAGHEGNPHCLRVQTFSD